jgi:hypothetical protein
LPGETVDQTAIFCNLLTNGIYNPIAVAYDNAIFTHEWTDVSFTFENPESGLCYVQFKAFRTHVIDDIVVSRELNFIAAPNIFEAKDYTMQGFTTEWNSVYSAEEYLLTVYRKNPVGVDTVYVLEGFDAINNDGTFIDVQNPNYPEGWNINLDAGDTRQVITGEGNYVSYPQAICMDAIGDTIILPNNGGRFTSVIINVKLVEYNGESGTIDFIVKRNGEWSSYTFMYLSGLYEYAGMDWASTEVLWNPNDYEDLAIVFNSEGNAVVAFDDIEYITTPPTEVEYMLHDYAIQDTSYVITSLDPASDYYFYVKAQNSNYTSVSSDWKKAFGLAAPLATDASEITENSYQANWDVHPKADRYEVHNYDVYNVPEDETNYIVLSEDFSLVQNGGTPENPIYDPEMLEKRLDEYTLYPDWHGVSTIYADGMIGSGYSDFVWGMIETPEMSLNHSETFHVKARIHCIEGETLVLLTSNDIHEITYSETGFQNLELDFATGDKSDRERIRILTGYGYNFLIDYLIVGQDVSAGDKLYTMINWNEIEGSENNHYVFDNLWYETNHNYAYDICAYHEAFGDEYTSEVSNRIDVNILTGTDGFMEETWSLYPNPANEKIVVACDNLERVTIYNQFGQQVYCSQNPVVSTSSFDNGVYMVHLLTKNGKSGTEKVVIAH